MLVSEFISPVSLESHSSIQFYALLITFELLLRVNYYYHYHYYLCKWHRDSDTEWVMKSEIKKWCLICFCSKLVINITAGVKRSSFFIFAFTFRTRKKKIKKRGISRWQWRCFFHFPFYNHRMTYTNNNKELSNHSVMQKGQKHHVLPTRPRSGCSLSLSSVCSPRMHKNHSIDP